MIDLHLHLDGSLLPEDILHLANCTGIPLPCGDAEDLRPLLEVEPDCRNLGEYLQRFDLPLQVLQTEEALELAVYFLLRRLARDGLCYGEIRFAPQLHQNRGLTQMQVVSAAVKGLNKGVTEFGIPAQLILCCMRGDDNRAPNLETVRVAKDFLGKGVCALDLAGNEFAYPTERFADVFGLAKQMNIPFIIHAGEAAGPESMWHALKLGARRIGHGVRGIEDPALISRLVQQKTPLELCFTSNLQTKAVENARDYPLVSFLKHGVCVTVNTDNMTVSATDLRREYRLLQERFGLTVDTLQTIACNGAAAAFVDEETSAELTLKIAKDFAAWLG